MSVLAAIHELERTIEAQAAAVERRQPVLAESMRSWSRRMTQEMLGQLDRPPREAELAERLAEHGIELDALVQELT